MYRLFGFGLILILSVVSGFNALAQDCDYLSKGNNMVQDKPCAPVTAQWEIFFGGVTGTGPIEVYVDWGDGTPPQILPATYNSVNNQWRITTSHIYPKGGNRCNYQPSTMLVVNGVLCTSSIQTQQVTVWDTDDENGGVMRINPARFPICLGDDGNVTFTDASQWNCVPPIELDRRNNSRRWIQWIYGTGGTTISEALVDGQMLSYPHTGPVQVTGQPIEDPVPPMNTSLPVYIPSHYNVGDYFEVTIRNWNVCNPYDDPSIPGPPADPINGDHPPVVTTAIAIIVALPDGSIGAAGPFCDNDQSVLLTAATPGGRWSGPGITNPNSRRFYPSIAGAGNHLITYNVTNADGCSASGTTNIQVFESPNISINVDEPIYMCPGLSVQLAATVTGGTPAYAIQWQGDTTPLSATNIYNPIFTTNTPDAYSLLFNVTDAQGCKSELPVNVLVDDIKIEFDPTPIVACQGVPVTIEPITSGGTQNYILHQWSGPHTDKLSATDIQNPVFVTTEIGTFYFTYRVEDETGCHAEATISVVVKEQPIANAGGNDALCGLNYTLNGSLSPANAEGLWSLISGPGTADFSDATAISSQITVSETGTYNLQWMADLDGCIASDDVTINFSSFPQPGIMPDVELCGQSIILEAFPDLGTGAWSMSSGTGSASFNDINAPVTLVEVDMPGQYEFTWTESAGINCNNAVNVNILFKPQAQAISEPQPDIVCSPATLTFPNQSINADSYIWELGGGVTSTDAEPEFTYENLTGSVRTYTITLTALNSYNCNDTFTFPLQVAPKPVVRASAAPIAGCSPLDVSFTNTTTGATSYSWHFSDDNSLSNEFAPQKTFINSNLFVTAYPVKLLAENQFGCIDSTEIQITVYPGVVMDLNVVPGEGCHPLQAELTATPGAMSYTWNTGDGNQIVDNFQLSHTFTNVTSQEVTYNIQVTGTNAFSCAATANGTITVYPSPEARFTVSPNELQMPDRTFALTNQTLGTGWSYEWDFGDGNQSASQNPGTYSYMQSGTYHITLTAFNNHCRSSASLPVLIRPMVPQIQYGTNPDAGCPPLTVTFTNNTLDATTYLWDFGDGRMSQESAPTHIYRVPGVYRVTLTATGSGGTATADDVEVVVYEVPTALFDVIPKVIFIPGENPAIINRSEGATAYYWDLGDGTTSSDFSPSHRYTAPGYYTITLRVTNNDGCEDVYAINEAVKVEQGGELRFPNAFTPNPSGPSGGRYQYGDPRNHVFYPFTQKGVEEYQLQIFTRWGELIFESNELETGWDGYHRGNLAQQGVYIWRARYKTSDGKVHVIAGDVTLIR